jgi:hypothetical protein
VLSQTDEPSVTAFKRSVLEHAMARVPSLAGDIIP